MDLKAEFKDYCAGQTKHFVKQGAFSLYHSKELDKFIKAAHKVLLREYFEDFLPSEIPFCVCAADSYSDFKLCANEPVPLFFVYKDIKAYHLKPMIKAFVALLNDIGFVVAAQICELGGIVGKARELRPFSARYLCGSKTLFKAARDEMQKALKLYKDEFAAEIFSYFQKPVSTFIKQEFNIKRDFGGISDYANLHDLLHLFKDSPKNYALNFISEKELSELRLAMDFLLSLQSAMNIQNNAPCDIFSLANAAEITTLMRKKDKKHLDAKHSLLQKAMNCLHIVGFYSRYIAWQIAPKPVFTPLSHGIFVKANGKVFIAPKQNFANLKAFLDALNSMDDLEFDFDYSVVVALCKMKITKKDAEAALSAFRTLLYRKYSFAGLKTLYDSFALKELVKAFAPLYFLPDEESVFSRDENALLALREFEREMSNFETLKLLSSQEKIVVKLSILMSASSEENEVSLANIYRAMCAKLNLGGEVVEFGLKVCKFYSLMKDCIEKEDIYNENVITSFISKLGSARNVKILHALTFINAKAMGVTQHFFYRSLDKFLANALSGFESSEILDESARRVKKEQALKRSRVFLQLDGYMQDKILHIESNLFIIKNSFENIVSVALAARDNDFKFWLNNSANFTLELVSIKAKLNLAGILNALSGLNLVFMSFFPLFDDKVYLKFEYANEVSDLQMAKYSDFISKNLRESPNKLKKPVIKKDELKFDLAYSKTYAKLNLNARDQQGLMAFVMSVFDELNLTLSAAKIQTIRARTRNTFYLKKTANLDEQRLINSLKSE